MTESQTELQTDNLDPARAAAGLVALGRSGRIAAGDPLPPFFHQLYFWSPHPPKALGRDGHPRVGSDGLIPDLGLPRRMWAGGRLVFRRPLLTGQVAQKHSCLEEQTRKPGRTGPLGFVTLRHEYHQNGRLCLSEWQDLLYREDPAPGVAAPVPPIAPSDETDRRAISFDSTLLFRYSALTFNGHRIHYDLTYARTVEGYAGLVVHGPLLAQLLMLFVQDMRGPLAGFSFRATAPLIHTETAELCLKGNDLWVRGPQGRLCMRAQFDLE